MKHMLMNLMKHAESHETYVSDMAQRYRAQVTDPT